TRRKHAHLSHVSWTGFETYVRLAWIRCAQDNRTVLLANGAASQAFVAGSFASAGDASLSVTDAPVVRLACNLALGTSMIILLLAPHPFFAQRGTPIAVRLVCEGLSRLGHT